MTRSELQQELSDLHDEAYGWAVVCCRGDRTAAEDLLHDTYLRVLEGRLKFGGRSSFKTWLFSILRRAARDRIRRSTVRAALSARWLRPPRAQPASSHRDLAGRERQQIVRQILSALSHRQRQILELVFFHDLTLRQAAEVIGVSLGTASRHYDRGKRAALEHLKEAALDL